MNAQFIRPVNECTSTATVASKAMVQHRCVAMLWLSGTQYNSACNAAVLYHTVYSHWQPYMAYYAVTASHAATTLSGCVTPLTVSGAGHLPPVVGDPAA